MRNAPRRLPRLLEVYLSRKGERWVVIDISGDSEPRSQRTVTLRLEGTTDEVWRKVLTMAFFLASYTLAEDQQGFTARVSPAPEMTPQARRAHNRCRLLVHGGRATRTRSLKGPDMQTRATPLNPTPVPRPTAWLSKLETLEAAYTAACAAYDQASASGLVGPALEKLTAEELEAKSVLDAHVNPRFWV